MRMYIWMFQSLTVKHNLYQHEEEITTREQPSLVSIVTSSPNSHHKNEKWQQCKKNPYTAYQPMGDQQA